MKKGILILFTFLISGFVVAQNPTINQQKYWYLRWRLKHYFMVVGEGPGMSLPQGARNRNCLDCLPQYAPGTYGAGDIANILGPYIGTLATEYKLLNESGQNTNGTLEELYYALKAINRLDQCEGQYPWTVPENPSENHLDGLCARSDGPDFVLDHLSELNQNITDFNVAIYPGDPEPIVAPSATHFDPLSISEHDRETAKRNASLMSQDHYSSIFLGLSFIKKYVPANTTFNGMNLYEEAQNITFRIWSYMHLHNWLLRYPDDVAISSDLGGIAAPFSYGFCSAAAYIDPNHIGSYMADGVSATTFVAFNGYGFDIGPVNDACDILYAQFDPCCIPPFFCTTEQSVLSTWIALNLACVGNAWNDATGINGVGLTQLNIYRHAHQNGWQAFYPLIHASLYDATCLTSNSTIEDDLNSMPCGGPYCGAPGGWGGKKKYTLSPSECSLTPDGDTNGKFTGIEYMLLFNLYCIHRDGDYVSTSGYFNSMDNSPLSTYPFGFLNYGSDDMPAHDWIFGTLTSSSTIHAGNTSISNGNVTFRAGSTIDLQDGFEVEYGASFEAYIDPYECTGNAYARLANADTDTTHEAGVRSMRPLKNKMDSGNEFTILPNPVTEKVTLHYSISTVCRLNISIHNIFGETVAVIHQNDNADTGNYESVYDASALAPGVYFCVLETPEYKAVKKLVKIR